MGVKHKAVGTGMTQTEWEAASSHVLDSVGIPYATASAEISVLSFGVNNCVLQCSASVPQWSSTPTLAGIVITKEADITSASITTAYIGAVSVATAAITSASIASAYLSAASITTAAISSASIGCLNLASCSITGTLAFASGAGDITFGDQDFVFSTATGTKFGTASTQKLGFWGVTPVVQLDKANYNNFAAVSDFLEAFVDVGLINAT